MSPNIDVLRLPGSGDVIDSKNTLQSHASNSTGEVALIATQVDGDNGTDRRAGTEFYKQMNGIISSRNSAHAIDSANTLTAAGSNGSRYGNGSGDGPLTTTRTRGLSSGSSGTLSNDGVVQESQGVPLQESHGTRVDRDLGDTPVLVHANLAPDATSITATATTTKPQFTAVCWILSLCTALVVVLVVVITILSTLYLSVVNQEPKIVTVTVTSKPMTAAPTINNKPTVAPSTSVPTLTPTTSNERATNQERATQITNFINVIKLSPGTLIVPMPESLYGGTIINVTTSGTVSAEEAALIWLVHYDPLQLWPDTDLNQRQLQQRYALLTLSLPHPSFVETTTTFKSTDSECQWRLVANCTFAVEQPAWVYVTHISTRYGGHDAYTLGSTLSPDVGLLTHLERFDLPFSNWNGTLPSSLGSGWSNLVQFDASVNSLTGRLPSSFGAAWTNLVHFDTSYNSLSGELPSLLGTTWTNLEHFQVSRNTLTGSLPSSLGTSWTNLQYIDVSRNKLTGSIPSLAKNWSSLEQAYFFNNSFVGSMPSDFCPITTGTAGLFLYADCDEVACPCCTDCCNDAAYCS